MGILGPHIYVNRVSLWFIPAPSLIWNSHNEANGWERRASRPSAVDAAGESTLLTAGVLPKASRE